ncbi:unnamed protein product [Protopolystoma xenopodis]|uniref:Dynein heavy chain AAA lid domain-containing protein n=1 Tax=Protopolystoma xenopodis TaxID=117903 RepID=A0A3S5AAN6_9PLAT|nr:unnamed protein product [Protopolystoma xenopodis]
MVPFDAITYLTGECNYGGRVTDEQDRRCLSTILADFFCIASITDPKYKLSPSGVYYIPPKMEYNEYLDFIKGLPTVQQPEVFGMHENVDITRELSETKSLFDSILRTMGQLSPGSDSKSETQLCDIAADILTKLPPLFNMELAESRFPVTYNESMNTVLVQEMERFNK